MIKNFIPRLYQETILATAVKKNTLVVLPTGLGKTNLFLMLAANRLSQYPDSKILLLGPTKPLIDQYLEVFENFFEIDKEKMSIFTGNVKPEKRAELWKNCRIIFSTPQGLENDIISNRIDLREVSLLGFDEAHRAIGDYSYVFVAKQYDKLAPHSRIIALTASPGTDVDKISEICKNLFIEEIEVRTDDDPDVKEYVQEVNIEWQTVELTAEFKHIQKYLKDFLSDRLEKLKKSGVLHRADLSVVNKKDLLALQAQLRGRAASGEKDFVLWNSISVLAEVMKVQHALELIETQGVSSLFTYMDKINKEGFTSKTKAVKNIVKDLNFRSALIKANALYENKVQHPKLIKLIEIIKDEISKNNQIKIIVFNQYRDNAADIVNELNSKGIKAQLFVGQTKKGDTGMSQKQQKESIDKFRNGEFNVLVGTSVSEEGLDIPQVNLVIFYEPIPSAIRTIQRRGRTGRTEEGRVIILMAKGTRDEGYRWSAHHKEKRMYRVLDKLKSNMKLAVKKDDPDQSILSGFVSDKKLKIYVDHREKGSKIIKDLIDAGIEVSLDSLKVGDYLLSNKVCVEYKTAEDFVNSLIDGRLMQQVKEIKNNFSRPIVLVEGVEDIYSVRNVHPNAIRGMLVAITVGFGVPILYSKNNKESALLLAMIAKREQEEKEDFSVHTSTRQLSLKEQQEYFVSSLPNVGSKLAKELLKKFGSVKNLVNASVEELKEVDKMGDVKANKLKDIFDKEYAGGVGDVYNKND